jgi:hypothetical protein
MPTLLDAGAQKAEIHSPSLTAAEEQIGSDRRAHAVRLEAQRAADERRRRLTAEHEAAERRRRLDEAIARRSAEWRWRSHDPEPVEEEMSWPMRFRTTFRAFRPAGCGSWLRFRRTGTPQPTR